MTRPEEYSVIQDVVKLLADDGFNALGEALRRVINQAMQLERQQHLGVGPYERSDARDHQRSIRGLSMKRAVFFQCSGR